MKVLQYLFISVVLLALGACSDLLGNEKLQDRLEKMPKKDMTTFGRNCGTTINAENPPEYVVNGKVWKSENIISELKPENISRIDVLKKPKGWKKYGFPVDIPGVVVITTKK